jgi:hypothetical protein
MTEPTDVDDPLPEFEAATLGNQSRSNWIILICSQICTCKKNKSII